MAIDFTASSTRYGPETIANPNDNLVMICWCRPRVLDADYAPMGLRVAGDNNIRHTFRGRANGSMWLNARDGVTVATASISAGIMQTDRWQLLVGVVNGLSDRRIYHMLDGVITSGTNTTTLTSVAIAEITIGALGAGVWPINGHVAEAYYYPGAAPLSSHQLTMLAANVPPFRIPGLGRPNIHVPLVNGPQNDPRATVKPAWTTTGSPVPEPTLHPPQSQQWQYNQRRLAFAGAV